MVAKKRHPGKRLQLFQLSRSRGQHFLAHRSAPGGSGQRQTEGATGGQGRHPPSWGLFTQERTCGGLGGAGRWPQTQRPWVALGIRSAVERIKDNQAGPGFRVFCFSALQPGASSGQTVRVGGLVILPLAFWFCTLGLPRDTHGPLWMCP